ncbi:MAG: ABC transporter permease [Inquilinaceae bacterium]
MVIPLGALERKLVRDLWRLRGQVLAVGLVIASGIALLVMALTSVEALQGTADAYYERYRFAQVFATAKRAPERLADRIAAIPGVQTADTRIVGFATLDIAGFDEPVAGQLVSIPERGAPLLNRLALRQGRWVEPGRPDEVIVSEPFAEAHGLAPGSRVGAVIEGHRRSLEVVGVALSPEFVYAIGPGALMPDDHRYGVLWLGREALAAAYDQDSAFNSVTLSLLRGTDPIPVIERLDALLERYGGTGAIARKDQISNWFLMNEIEQQKTMAWILPTIFLAVSAFLTNMVLARLIATERSEIGLMKAFGYSDFEVGWHYAKLVIAITSVGIAIGWAAGAWLGLYNTQVRAEFYRFPFLLFRPGPSAFAVAALVSLGAALAGTLGAVRRAARLPPAEAMRPPAPPYYRRSRLSGSRLGLWLDQPTRIVLRQILRWPVRAFLTAAGFAMAVAVLIASLQWLDSIDEIAEMALVRAQRQDVMIALAEDQGPAVLAAVDHLPGVLASEPMRIAGADLRVGSRSHRGSVQGVPSHPRLQVVYDASGDERPVPPDGLILSTDLAEKLGVERGDRVWIEVLEGRRPQRAVPVVDIFETYIGMMAYMNLDALNQLLGDGPRVEHISLLVDEARMPEFFAELKGLPQVAAVMIRRAAVDTFRDTMDETLLVFVSFFIVFSSTLAFGTAYNSVRIALSERGRELATLRVLGFSRGEISYILLGEVGLLILAGLPLGCVAGYLLTLGMAASFATELFRVPMVLLPATYATAASISLAAAIAAAAVVRRRVDRLDLVAVLKTRE